MREREWLSPGHSSLRHLLIATIYTASILPAQAVVEVKDQTVTVDQATAQVSKTKMPSMSDKKPAKYFVEIRRSQELKTHWA